MILTDDGDNNNEFDGVISNAEDWEGEKDQEGEREQEMEEGLDWDDLYK